jgi:hypothetical protein
VLKERRGNDLNVKKIAEMRNELDIASAINSSLNHFNLGYIEPGDGTRYMIAWNHLTYEQGKAWGGATKPVAHFIFDTPEGWRGRAPRQMFAYSSSTNYMTLAEYCRLMGQDNYVSVVGFTMWCFITGSLDNLIRETPKDVQLFDKDPHRWGTQIFALLSTGTIHHHYE